MIGTGMCGEISHGVSSATCCRTVLCKLNVESQV